MDFTTMFFFIIGLSVIGLIGTVIFWGSVAFLGIKAVQNYQKQLDSMKTDYQSTLSNIDNAYGGEVPPEVQQQLLTQYLTMQNQLSQFDNLSRQKHDLFVSDLRSQASSIGIDVSSWN